MENEGNVLLTNTSTHLHMHKHARTQRKGAQTAKSASQDLMTEVLLPNLINCDL